MHVYWTTILWIGFLMHGIDINFNVSFAYVNGFFSPPYLRNGRAYGTSCHLFVCRRL